MKGQCKWKMAFSILRSLPSGGFENTIALRIVLTAVLNSQLKQQAEYCM